MKKKKNTAKFDAHKYIKDNYLRNGKAVITVSLSKIEDFYNPLDSTRLTLAENIVSYINSEANYIPFRYPIVLEFKCPNITDEDKVRVKEIIKANYGLLLNDENYIIRSNYIKALWLFLLGVFIITCSILVSKYSDAVVLEVLSVAGWVSLWEAIDIWLLYNNKYRTKRLNTLQLFNAEVLFSD